MDGAGNLYGVTSGLGEQGSFGTVFEIQLHNALPRR
jgi:hypothetical protein